MSHISAIALENHRSFRETRCRLSPFTLIVGANNSGKTNLLKAVQVASALTAGKVAVEYLRASRHHASPLETDPIVHLTWDDGKITNAILSDDAPANRLTAAMRELVGEEDPDAPAKPSERDFAAQLEIYRLDPNLIGRAEGGSGEPYIDPSGVGVSWMLDKWASGSRSHRARFEQVVTALRRCVPEIEALSFYDEDVGKRAIQVEQTGLPEPVPLAELSDGTRLVLALLTLVNQPEPPPVLLLEDIDRGLHPRLYEQIVAFLRSLAAEGRTQILATTHDPYLIDEFRDTPEAVVIVEKKDGASTLSNLDDRLKAILEPGEELEMPLGQVWFTGLVGGVPRPKLPEILRVAEQ